MDSYECKSCGYIQSSKKNKKSKDNFEQTPEDWVCPTCWAAKSNFKKLGPEYQTLKTEFDKKQKK